MEKEDILMLWKFGAVLTAIASVLSGVNAFHCFFHAKEKNWDLKYTFLGIVSLLDSVVQVIMACDFWEKQQEQDDWEPYLDNRDEEN